MSHNCCDQIKAEDLKSEQDTEITSNQGDQKKLHAWVNRQTTRYTSLSSLHQYFENVLNEPKEVFSMVHSCMFSFEKITFFIAFAYTNEYFSTNVTFNSCLNK